MSILIKNGRVIDPSCGTDRTADLLIEDGRIAGQYDCGTEYTEDFDKVIDAEDCWVVPGLIDLHVHFRDPGQEYKEDIISGCSAAAAGGFTAVCCMPNTVPAVDSPETVKYIIDKAGSANGVRVMPAAAITIGQRGEELTDFEALKRAGAPAVSEDGRSVADTGLMREAFRKAVELDIPVLDHTEQPELKDGGCMHLGSVSERAGLKGIPSEAEAMIAVRDMLLAGETGARLHLQHISSKLSLDLIRTAKKEWGLNVTAETGPHYFTLTDEDAAAPDDAADSYHIVQSPSGMRMDTHRKMNPPLGSAEDREAVIEALMDGTIDAVSTDHAPHSMEEKSRPFDKAPFGVTGLETSFAVSYTELVMKHGMEPLRLIDLMSTAPAGIIGCPGGTLAAGSPADVAIIDVNEEYTIPEEGFRSKAVNTPFAGRKVYGRVMYTIAGGRIIFGE